MQKEIYKLVKSLDPSFIKSMNPGELVQFQQMINKHAGNLKSLVVSIKTGNVEAFSKTIGKKIPKILLFVFN